MQMKFIRCGLWLLLAAGTLVLAGNVMAEEQLDVVVDGGPVSFTVRALRISRSRSSKCPYTGSL